MDAVEFARQLRYIREAQGQNHGLRVEAIQHWSGGQFGDSWCMEFVWFVLDIVTGGTAIPRFQSVQAFREYAEGQGWAVDDPEPGDLFLYVDANDHAHHIGFVTNTDPLTGLAGNTSADGTSSNGDRVAEHAITAHHFLRVPT